MFEKKKKEPKLSSEMENILNKSIGDKIDSNIDDIYRYKYKIMNLLTSNQDILHTLHNNNLAGNDDIINGDLYRDICIFDYMKLPDLKSEVKNYICFEVDDNSNYNNLINKRITFRTVSHEDDCKTDWGISRQDLLASIIKTEFDWTNALGMHLEKSSDIGYVADGGYYYREICYNVTAPNNIRNKISNRF